jgi:hypothetical protein
MNSAHLAQLLKTSEEMLRCIDRCTSLAIAHDLQAPMALLWLMASAQIRSPSTSPNHPKPQMLESNMENMETQIVRRTIWDKLCTHFTYLRNQSTWLRFCSGQRWIVKLSGWIVKLPGRIVKLPGRIVKLGL